MSPHVIDSPFAPITVCVPSSTMTRYVGFEESLSGVYVPKDSIQLRYQSMSPARNRNDGIRDAPDVTTHWFFVDDDSQFERSILIRLLSHRLPIVCALVAHSKPNFGPVLWHGTMKGPEGRWQHVQYRWSDLDGKRGLMPVFAAAGSGVLVSREVLDKIGDPWFELGRYSTEDCSEDFYFYEKVRAAGYQVTVDLEARMGHYAPCAAWPTVREDGLWTVELRWENNLRPVRLGRNDAPFPGVTDPSQAV